MARGSPRPSPRSELAALGLEQLHGVARGIVHDDLATAVALDDLAPERASLAAEYLDRLFAVFDGELEAVPSARGERAPVGHRLARAPGPRRLEEDALRALRESS